MKINETVRKDGFRIISCHLPHKKSVLVELVARVGYAYDTPGKPGLFHCFEHMAFKGTKKRSAEELRSFSSQNFFSENAATGAMGTTYYVSAIDRNLPLACDYLSDICFNPTFPDGELKIEKQTILLEIARKNDSDFATANLALRQLLYKENPLRLSGSGTAEGIKRINHDDLVKQKEKWHLPSNAIAIAVGSVNHGDFVKEISRRIPFNSRKVPLRKWSDESNEKPEKNEIIIKRPKRAKTIVMLGCKIPIDIDRQTLESLSFYAKMIGLGQNSILWKEVREKGLAYALGCGISGSAGVGDVFSVVAEVQNSKYPRVINLLEQLLSRPISDKKHFESLRETAFDAFEVIAAEHADFNSYEGLIWSKITKERPVKEVETDYQKRLAIIRHLTLKDVEDIRKRFIKPENFARVIVVAENK